jgi:hypothetical protein
MAAHARPFRLLFALVVLAGPMVWLSVADGQGLDDGKDALMKQWSPHRKLIRALFKGETLADPNDKQHVEAVDAQAKYVTYLVYVDHLEHQPGKIEAAYHEFESDLTAFTKIKEKDRQSMQPLADLYRDRVREHALEVIQHPRTRPIHRIHAARILAGIALLGQGKLAETLILILKEDKQTEGVHFWALRAFRDLLALPPQMPPILTKDAEGKCAEAIIEFLQRTPPLSAGAPAEEVDGYRYLRREAVRALAQIHVPAFSAKVRPALVLARFAGEDDSIKPRPRLDERVEAAIGLARMQSAQSKEYQPDYAASMIGKTLTAFGNEYNANRDESLLKRRYPWKIDAVRLIDGLTALKTDSGKNPHVAKVVERGLRVALVVEKGSTNVDAGDLTWFTNPDNDPPSKELFKGMPDSVVKPAAAEAPKAESTEK